MIKACFLAQESRLFNIQHLLELLPWDNAPHLPLILEKFYYY